MSAPEVLVVAVCPDCGVLSLTSLTIHSSGCEMPTANRFVYRLTDRCADCDGTGTWAGVDCPACLGSGRRRDVS